MNFETGATSSAIRANTITPQESHETYARMREILESIGKISNELTPLNFEIYGNGTGYMNQPILSKDGTEVAGTIGLGDEEHIVIQKINSDGSCSTVDKLPFMGGKVNFSHPIHGKKGMVAYSKTNLNDPSQPEHAYVYDREKEQEIRISDDNEVDARSPGFTKDGRVLYRAEIDGVVGVRIVSVHDENGNRCSQQTNTTPPVSSSHQ